MATIYCQGRGVLRLLEGTGQNATCIFADVRRFRSDEDDRFFPVDVEIYETGPTYRLAPPIEIGFGIGLIHFNSERLEGGDVTRNHLTLSFPRIAFKPLLLFPGLQNVRQGNLGFIQYYFRETRIIGELTEADFSPKPGARFRAVDENVSSTGFLIDVVALVRLFTNR
jgi:hypothetical protein